MKNLLRIYGLLLPLAICIAANAQSTKQEKKVAKRAEIKQMIDGKDFAFEATYVIPERGGSRQLDYYYDLRVSPDTVRSYLPYFGRAYLAPNTPDVTEGGIAVNTTKFKYTSVLNKKGSWNITITPLDRNIIDWRDVQRFYLTVSPDGYASLDVISSNRDAISFNGYIDKRKPATEKQKSK